MKAVIMAGGDGRRLRPVDLHETETPHSFAQQTHS